MESEREREWKGRGGGGGANLARVNVRVLIKVFPNRVGDLQDYREKDSGNTEINWRGEKEVDRKM